MKKDIPFLYRDQTKPKGLLVAIGGNEDKEKDLQIFSTILSLIKKGKRQF